MRLQGSELYPRLLRKSLPMTAAVVTRLVRPGDECVEAYHEMTGTEAYRPREAPIDPNMSKEGLQHAAIEEFGPKMPVRFCLCDLLVAYMDF